MRSIFEYMASMIIMILISFIFVSLLFVEMQIVKARNYHTRVIENIQNIGDYNNLDYSDFDENFSFELVDENTLKVTYQYEINTPFFGSFDTKTLVGYAR